MIIINIWGQCYASLTREEGLLHSPWVLLLPPLFKNHSLLWVQLRENTVSPEEFFTKVIVLDQGAVTASSLSKTCFRPFLKLCFTSYKNVYTIPLPVIPKRNFHYINQRLLNFEKSLLIDGCGYFPKTWFPKGFNTYNFHLETLFLFRLSSKCWLLIRFHCCFEADLRSCRPKNFS